MRHRERAMCGGAHENTREAERLNSHQTSWRLRAARLGHNSQSTRRYPIRVRRDPDRELFRLLELLPHCALREHPRELPGWREVRLSIVNAAKSRLRV
jgi:hypothetical protein